MALDHARGATPAARRHAPGAVLSARALRAACAVTLLAGLPWALALGARGDLRDWTLTHWAFDYADGFARRSLVGESLARLFPHAELRRAALAASLLVALACCAWLARRFGAAARARRTEGAVAFATVALVHPATLQHVAYDIGRFDQIGLLLLLAGIAVVRRGRQVAVLVGALGALGLLVHEAFAFLHLPLLLAYWVHHTPPRGARWVAPITVVLALGLILLAIIRFGEPREPHAAVLSRLRAQHGDWVQEGSVAVLHGDARAESRRALRILLTPRRIGDHLLLMAALVPTFVLVGATVRAVPRGRTARRPRDALLLLAACCPLLLSAVGVDFYRWWAAALTNVLLAAGLLLEDAPAWRRAAELAFATRRRLVWTAMALGLLLGPLGVASAPFPRVQAGIYATMNAAIAWVR